MDWDLWPAIIRHGRATANFADVSAHMETITHEMNEVAAEIGRRIGVVLTDAVEAINKAFKEAPSWHP